MVRRLVLEKILEFKVNNRPSSVAIPAVFTSRVYYPGVESDLGTGYPGSLVSESFYH
jgi:hypothetical protein